MRVKIQFENISVCEPQSACCGFASLCYLILFYLEVIVNLFRDSQQNKCKDVSCL